MLKVESQGSVLRLTLARPEVRNAFNRALIDALVSAFATVEVGCRVVVLSGEGKAFCAGGDLNWMREAASKSIEENEQDALALAGLFDAIAELPAIVVCHVHGAVFGGGCGLAAASDYCIAEEGAQFSFSEARLGLVPATISRHVIPKIGRGHARALFSTAMVFDAAHAQRIGLVHDVCPAQEAEKRREQMIQQILSVGPQAAAASKSLAQGDILSAQDSAKLLSRVRSSDEAKEGIRAFLDRRDPSYKETLS
jgi:methylglutaconyl-CoA hydratase